VDGTIPLPIGKVSEDGTVKAKQHTFNTLWKLSTALLVVLTPSGRAASHHLS
jgi:hypothetical protein